MTTEQLPEEIYATFSGQINQDAIGRLFHNFPIAVNDGVKTVHLLIHSRGGLVSEGIAAHNYLSNLPLDIVTYNCGAVESIAVVLFLAGTIRKCSVNSTFTIHKTTYAMQNPLTAFDLRHHANAAELSDKNTDTILRRHINMPEDKWAMRGLCDLTITAQEAEQFGLVDEISDFCPPRGAELFNI